MHCPNPQCGSTNCRPNKLWNLPRASVEQGTVALQLRGHPLAAGALRAAWEGMEFVNSKRTTWRCNDCGAKF